MAATDRATAERLDRDDPLASLRDQFVIDDPDLLYLDGNSLGRLPRRSIERLRTVVEREWGSRLIRSWNERWMDLPLRAGDRIGEHLVGAAPGQVAVSDSTSVNLYKLAVAALDARPDRRVIVSDRHNFPSDRYVLEGLARARGHPPSCTCGGSTRRAWCSRSGGGSASGTSSPWRRATTRRRTCRGSWSARRSCRGSRWSRRASPCWPRPASSGCAPRGSL